jgi:hypothetical protein
MIASAEMPSLLKDLNTSTIHEHEHEHERRVDMQMGDRQETLQAHMAHPTQAEFQRAIALLAKELGLQRLRDRFVQLNALVTRRKVSTPESLADQLYMLSAGLRRQVPATYAFHHVWAEYLSAKIGEDGEKTLEKLAEAVNACLGEKDSIIAEKAAELDAALTEYERTLSHAVGPELARMDMLLKAVPVIAEKLRTAPLQNEEPPAPQQPS